MILSIVILAVALVALVLQDRSHRVTLNNTIGAYENSLAWERTRVDNLLVQVQANSQGLQHHPMIGPISPEVEDALKHIVDETGLIDVAFDPDDDMDLFDDFGVKVS